MLGKFFQPGGPIHMLLNQIISIIPFLFQIIGSLIKLLAPIIQEILKVAVTIITTLLPVIIDLIKNLIPPILEILQLLLPVLTKALVMLVKYVLPYITSLITFYVEYITNLFTFIADILKSFFQFFKDIKKIGVRKAFKKLLKNLRKDFMKYVSSMVKSITKFITSIYKGYLKPIIDSIVDFISPFLEKFQTFVSNIKGGISNINPFSKENRARWKKNMQEQFLLIRGKVEEIMLTVKRKVMFIIGDMGFFFKKIILGLEQSLEENKLLGRFFKPKPGEKTAAEKLVEAEITREAEKFVLTQKLAGRKGDDVGDIVKAIKDGGDNTKQLLEKIKEINALSFEQANRLSKSLPGATRGKQFRQSLTNTKTMQGR
jgi:hypothetical protein